MLLAQLLVTGLAIGSIYALVAFGYSLTWATSRTVNFALGQVVMLGAVLGYLFVVTLGLPLPLAVLAVIPPVVLLALGTERFAVRPFRATPLTWLMSTIALGIILENGALLTFGKDARTLPSPLAERPIQFVGAGVYPQELLIPLVSLGLVGLVGLMYRRTLLGRMMRATAFDPEAAGVVGIDVDRMIALSYVLSSVLAALAGILIAPVTFVSATMGTVLGLKSFAVAIIGSLTSPLGILLAGLLFGVFEQLIAGLVGTGARDAGGFGLAILVLLLRPGGLLGGAALRRV